MIQMAPTKAAVVALLSLVALLVTPCQGFAAAQWPSLRVQAPAAPQARPSPSPGGLRQSRMSVVDAVKSFPWVLIPGGVAAGILVREGGLGAIGAFFEDTLDYLEDKGGYVITEEQLKGGAGQEPKVNIESINDAFNRPKRTISTQSVWILVAMMFSAPILAWLQVAVNGGADLFHLDKL